MHTPYLHGRRFVSLRFKVFFLACLIAIIPITVIGSTLYQRSVAIVKQKQEMAAIGSLRNIAASLESIMNYTRDVSLMQIQNRDVRSALLGSPATPRNLEDQTTVLGSLMFYLGQQSSIDSIYIEGDNGVRILAGNYRQGTLGDSALERMVSANGGQVWTYTTPGQGAGAESYISLIRSIKDINNLRDTLGMQRINISTRFLIELFENHTDAYGGKVLLVDGEGNIIAPYSQAGDTFVSPELFAGMAGESGTLEDMAIVDRELGGSGVVYYMQVPKTSWKLVSAVRFSEMLRENEEIRSLLLVGVTVSLVLCFGISALFSYYILSPLRQLTESIIAIREDNHQVSLDFRSNDEIGILSIRFNEMSRRLNELIHQVLLQKLHREQAELKALYAQVDPHFLYNNLDTAYWMSRMEKAEKTGSILLSLSALYRLSLSNTEKIIPVGTELEHIRHYIHIQRMRLNDLVDIQLAVQPETEQLSTVRFVLQPLVENAVLHGIMPHGEHGKIHITVRIQGPDLRIDVQDDGGGADLAELDGLLRDSESQDTRGLAIRNIDQRIQMCYGERYGISFSAAEPRGLIAAVLQPCIPFSVESE